MARTNITRKTENHPKFMTAAVSNLQDAMDRMDNGSTAFNTPELSVAAASGALSVACELSNVELDGTDARSLAAPTFPGQVKTVQVITGANTPILVLTVTGMRNSTQNVWTLTGFVAATAPRAVTFKSYDGVVWDCVGIVSPGDASGVTVA
jgi:hypothetical protein